MSETPVHIGLIGPLPPPPGGMANQTLQLNELLLRDGHRVELVQMNAPYSPAWAGRIPVLRAGVRLLPYLWRLWRVAGKVQLLHVMANSGWSWHLFAAPAIWIARLRGCPVVVNYRGGEADAFLSGPPIGSVPACAAAPPCWCHPGFWRRCSSGMDSAARWCPM